MPAGDLTDLAHVGPWLKMTSAQYLVDPILPGLISDCSDAFVTATQRGNFLASQITERRDGNGKQRMVFGRYPVSSVASVVVDNYSLAASPDGVKPGYVFDQYSLSIIGWPAGTGIGELNPYTLTIGSFSKGFGNVQLVYTAGFAKLPGDILRAVTMWVAHLYRSIEHIGEKSHHFEQGQTTSYDTGEMPDFVEKVVARYRRLGMAGDGGGEVLSAIPLVTIGGAGNIVTNETPSGTIDGVNSVFTLLHAPAPVTSLALYRNGLRQAMGGDFTLSGTQITFSAGNIPQPGDTLLADYEY